LPLALRNRFTEIYLDENVGKQDLMFIVHNQLKAIVSAPIWEIVNFYLNASQLAEEKVSRRIYTLSAYWLPRGKDALWTKDFFFFLC
jgi:midasin (ATPase involved in ribosome maturation)